MSFLDFLKVQRQGLEGMASVGVIGMHMVSGPLVGVTIGYFLDKWLGTGPWLKLVFLFIGIGAGFLNVYMDTRHLIRKLDRQALISPPPAPKQGEAQGGRADPDSGPAGKDSTGETHG